MTEKDSQSYRMHVIMRPQDTRRMEFISGIRECTTTESVRYALELTEKILRQVEDGGEVVIRKGGKEFLVLLM